MNACFLVRGGAGLSGAVAVVVWIAAVMTYVTLWRRFDGPRRRLVVSSLWLIEPGSLGEAVEPLRRQLALRFVAFMLAALAAIALAVLAATVC